MMRANAIFCFPFASDIPQPEFVAALPIVRRSHDRDTQRSN